MGMVGAGGPSRQLMVPAEVEATKKAIEDVWQEIDSLETRLGSVLSGSGAIVGASASNQVPEKPRAALVGEIAAIRERATMAASRLRGISQRLEV